MKSTSFLWNQLSENAGGQNKNMMNFILLYNTLTWYLKQRICWCFLDRAFRNNMFSMPHVISAGYCCCSFLRSTTVVLHFKSEITACLHFVVGHWVVLQNCYRNFNNESMRRWAWAYFRQIKVWDWLNLWIKAELKTLKHELQNSVDYSKTY